MSGIGWPDTGSSPRRDDDGLLATDPRTDAFERLCDEEGLRYKGRPLRSVPFERVSPALQLEGEAFDIAAVRSFLALQLAVFRASARVRSWMAEESTEWATRLNAGAPAVSRPHVLWCRGDELLHPSGRVYWAEQEVDDGSLGAGTALELAYLGTCDMVDSYAATLRVAAGSSGVPRVAIVTSASYGPYVPQLRFFARMVRERHAIHVDVVEETAPDFTESVRRAIDEGRIIHNFFESHRSDRFFRDHWVPLFEAWLAGDVAVWPAPATLYEWKGWPVVLHDPSLLEDDARALVDQFAGIDALRDRLPFSVFLGARHADELRRDRRRYLLKPAFGGGSYGVRAGPELWQRSLDRLMKDLRPHQYVLQELVETRRVSGMHSKLSPHYFLALDDRPIIVHVMLRDSRVVHGQADTVFSVTRVAAADCRRVVS